MDRKSEFAYGHELDMAEPSVGEILDLRRAVCFPWSVFAAAVILFLCGFCNTLPAEASDKTKHVLLLNSYHKGYPWTDEITRGVEETLTGRNIDLHVEYMDTKRQFGREYLLSLADLLRMKYFNRHYDVVISSDNNAFDFLREHGEQILGNTPVVFCGVNYLKKYELEGLSRFNRRQRAA